MLARTSNDNILIAGVLLQSNKNPVVKYTYVSKLVMLLLDETLRTFYEHINMFGLPNTAYIAGVIKLIIRFFSTYNCYQLLVSRMQVSWMALLINAQVYLMIMDISCYSVAQF